MTPKKPIPKTPIQLASEHWEFIETMVFTQMKLTMLLFREGFIHGYRHGKENKNEKGTSTKNMA